MNGQMSRYKESLKNTSQPIPLSKVSDSVDLKALFSYAKSKNTKVSNLTEAEKRKFVVQLTK